MDVIVIGAGFAGLAAAGRLARAGCQVTLVEARDRVGGRVWTASTSGPPVELGAEWIANTGVVKDVLTTAGARLIESEGSYVRRVGRELRPGWETQPSAEGVLQRAMALPGPDRSLLDALAELGVDPATAGSTLGYVEGFHTADPREVG